LVFDPSEKFFWSQNILPAANDGGQRMDSSRFWNTVRSPEDWQRTRDLWDLGTMRIVDHAPGQYDYAMGDASNAYSREKVKTFTRESLYVPRQNVLFVFDRVVSGNASFHKAWLLHGVNQPSVDANAGIGYGSILCAGLLAMSSANRSLPTPLAPAIALTRPKADVCPNSNSSAALQ